jgi:hypothetical protein
MPVMRQRLLLVAGWIVAAVGAGVVASGAVAVAGGQVFDRSIRPLNAAEVAALPVDESVATLGSSERLASGGSQARTRITSEGCGRITAGASGSERPAGPGGAPAEPGDPVIDLPRSPPTVTHTSGGSVILSCVGDTLQVLWASPQPNYTVGIQFDAGLLTITFTSESHVSTISADSDPGGDITIDTDEHAIR